MANKSFYQNIKSITFDLNKNYDEDISIALLSVIAKAQIMNIERIIHYDLTSYQEVMSMAQFLS